MTVPGNPLTMDRYVYERLTGDPTVMAHLGGEPKVYADVAPLGTTAPWVIYSLTSASDVMGVGQARYWSRLQVLIRCTHVGESFAPVDALYQRVDALLHGSAGTVTGMGQVLSVIRQEPVRFTEQADGQQYRHLGGTYEFLVQ